MSNSTSKELYDQWHSNLGEQGEDNSNAPWHQMTKPHLGNIQGGKVLEIGCGREGIKMQNRCCRWCWSLFIYTQNLWYPNDMARSTKIFNEMDSCTFSHSGN